MSKSGRENNGEREVHRLKGIISRLTKQLKEARKYHRLLDTEEHSAVEEVTAEAKKNDCPSCQEGILKLLDLGTKSYLCCNSCNYREKLK